MKATQIRELGWFVTADDFAGGLVTEETVRRQLARSVEVKRAFLASHTYTPGTVGEGTHERVSAWCDRAEAVLAGEEAGER